jgi:hypothetical protein
MFSSSEVAWDNPVGRASLRVCFFNFFETLNSGFLVTSQHVFKFEVEWDNPVGAGLSEGLFF